MQIKRVDMIDSDIGDDKPTMENKNMEIEEWEKKGLDSEVIPLVKFFNDNGLKTHMSCQGHNKTNMSMYYSIS